MSKTSTAFSTKTDVYDAVNELKSNIDIDNPKAVIFFASTIYPPDSLSAAMKNAFQNSLVFGCTSAGEHCDNNILKGSIVAMAFSEEVFEDIHLEVVQRIREEDNVETAIKNFENHFKCPVLDMDFNSYFGFVLFDGLSMSEEKIMASLGSMANMIFVGGSAGDDLKFRSTLLFANGNTYEDAALLVLVKSKAEFSFIKTQSFDITDKKIVATKVNEAEREVIEFNGKPAAEEYARILGTSVDLLESKFLSNPFGLIIDNEPFVRSAQAINGTTIKLYCNIIEGTELTILSSRSIVEDTKKVIDDIRVELGDISGIVSFNCILRALELEAKKQQPEYGEIFKGIPTVGFSTYGEAYLGHLNQTATMLVLK